MAGIVAELEALARQATAERISAEMVERESLFAVETAKAETSAASGRRTELVEAIAATQTAEDGCRDRLGDVRLQRAAAAREAERLGDLAAAGGDAASRALGKAIDTAETLDALTLAHERRTEVAVAARQQAEGQLEDHDAAEALHLAEQIEAMLAVEARRLDGIFASACKSALAIGRLVNERKSLKPTEAWVPVWRSGSLHDHVVNAAAVGLARTEMAFGLHGATHSRGLPSMSSLIGNLVACWRHGRGEIDASTPEPREAA